MLYFTANTTSEDKRPVEELTSAIRTELGNLLGRTLTEDEIEIESLTPKRRTSRIFTIGIGPQDLQTMALGPDAKGTVFAGHLNDRLRFKSVYKSPSRDVQT